MAKTNSGSSSKGSSRGSSSKSSSSKSTSSKSNTSSRGSGGDSKGLGNVGWGGGSKGPSFGGGSYKSSTSFGRGDTGSSFGNFGGSGGGSSKSRESRDRESSKPSMSFGPTSYTPTTQFGKEAAGMTGPSGGLPTGALKQVAPLQQEYNLLDEVKGFFTSLNPFADKPEEAAAGFSPLGGWASYGGALPGQEDPRGFFDKLGDSFQKFGWGLQDAPLKTIANALSNPMMSAVGVVTGTLPAMAAVRAASAVSDVATGVSDLLGGAQELASTAISATPLGSALGPMRGVVGGLIKGPEQAGKAIAQQAGGVVGSNVFGNLAMSLTDNPYAGAIASAAGGALSATGLGNLVSSQMGRPAVPQRTPEVADRTAGADVGKAMKSPLLAAQETSQNLMKQEADPTKYIREMQLPFYGPSYTMNPYGFPNTMIGA